MSHEGFEIWAHAHPDNEVRASQSEWEARMEDIARHNELLAAYALHLKRQESPFWDGWPT